jgi:hypothetical protein
MKIKGIIALVSSLLISACSNIGDEDLKTENLTSKFRVISNGVNITTEAQFYNSSNGSNAITLDSADIVRVHFDGRTIILTELNQQGVYTNSVSISSHYEDDNFRFSLERAEEIGAPNSSIYLPSAFTATTESSAGAIFYTDPITVNWDGESANDTSFNILRIYTCLDADDTQFVYHKEESFDADDVTGGGDVTINDSGLLIDDNLVSCNATIELGRIVSSGVDNRFKGGEALGIQKRTLNVSLVFVEPEPEPEVVE